MGFQGLAAVWFEDFGDTSSCARVLWGFRFGQLLVSPKCLWELLFRVPSRHPGFEMLSTKAIWGTEFLNNCHILCHSTSSYECLSVPPRSPALSATGHLAFPSTGSLAVSPSSA